MLIASVQSIVPFLFLIFSFLSSIRLVLPDFPLGRLGQH